MQFSNYQKAIFDFGVNGTGNAVVKAVAGSGKTTTLVELIRQIRAARPATQSIFLAFNKSIADELKKRGVNARTFHSLCFGPVLRYRGAKEVNGDKMYDVIDSRLGEDEAKMYGRFVETLVGLGKQQGIDCLIDDSPSAWMDLVSHHNLELEHDQAEMATAIKYASAILKASNASDQVNFDDLLYFAVKDGISLPKFDLILVDEAQDTNAIQRAILRKIMANGARVIAVGDPAQAIYGFRGADSESINIIREEFSATELPLTVSYRCPQAVVKHAQQWVSHIEHHDDAPEGMVVEVDRWNHTLFTPNDLVVCRTTAPVVSLAFRLLRNNVPANILGKDIGKGIKALIKKLNAKGVEHLLEKLSAWEIRESERAIAKRQEAQAEAVHDKASTIRFLVESLLETDRSVPALMSLIDSLFADKRGAVLLSTIHKSKGMEADRVFWLNSSRCPARWAKQDWQQEQERNLCYVATTRAKKELHLIEDDGYTESSK